MSSSYGLQRCMRLALLLGSTVLAVPARGDTLVCGSTIGPLAGTVMAENSPSCLTGATPAVTVVGPGTTLDLNGHVVDCLGGTDVGIRIEGERVTVKNGSLAFCNVAGVQVAGTGKHTVKNVASFGNTGDGFQITAGSDKNKISNCSSSANLSDGFFIDSDKNKFDSSDSYNNGADGFLSVGDDGGDRDDGAP